MKNVSVRNMTGHSGREVSNQFIITTPEGEFFQSYETVIAHVPEDPAKPIQLDKNNWDYSVTTAKYRNKFLGENKSETARKIKSGEYILTDLNK